MLFHGMKKKHNEGKKNLVYFLLFVIRRLIFITTAFTLINHGGIQIMVLNYINLFVITYFGQVYPLKVRLKNHIEFSNEVFVQFATFHFVCFTDFVGEAQTQYYIGFSLILLIALNVIINFGFMLIQVINDVRLVAILTFNYMKRFAERFWKTNKSVT